MSSSRYDQIQATLRGRGRRMTPQRQTIIQIVAEDSRHPTVEQIYERVRERFPTTSRATVYKTLALLQEADELVEYQFSEGGNRYDATRLGHHAHVVCTGCGRMEDVEVEGADGSLLAEADARSSFRVGRQRLEFHGTCPRCQVSEAGRAITD